MVVILVAIAVLIFLVKHHFHCEDSLAAVNAWCDASEAFTDWRLRNQGVYIGLSEEGRRLLAANLEGYDWFCRTHKFIDGTKHREWLVSLFYDLPSKHPQPFGKPKSGAQNIERLFLSKTPYFSSKSFPFAAGFISGKLKNRQRKRFNFLNNHDSFVL